MPLLCGHVMLRHVVSCGAVLDTKEFGIRVGSEHLIPEGFVENLSPNPPLVISEAIPWPGPGEGSFHPSPIGTTLLLLEYKLPGHSVTVCISIALDLRKGADA